MSHNGNYEYKLEKTIYNEKNKKNKKKITKEGMKNGI